MIAAHHPTSTRIIVVILLCAGVFVAPFYFWGIATLIAMFAFRNFREGVAIFLLGDLLYGGASTLTQFPYMMTVLAGMLLLAISYGRSKLRESRP
jgi:hypothetical protein